MMTLKDLLYVTASNDGNYILFNTDNGSWPPRYRYQHEHPAAIFRNIQKDGDIYKIFNTEVQRICANTSVRDEISNKHIVIDVHLNMYEDFVIEGKKQGE